MNDENCPAKEMATKNKRSAPSPPEIADFQKKSYQTSSAGHTTGKYRISVEKQ